MNYSRFITYLGIIVWLLPPIRQRGTKYFWFFLILALSDPLFELMKLVSITKSPDILYLFVPIACFLALLGKIVIKKYFYLVLLLISLPVVYVWKLHSEQYFFLLFNIALMLLLFKFIFDFITELQKNREVNVFLIILMFYIISILTKIDSVITGFAGNYNYYFITNILDILLGLFFAVFKYGTRLLVYDFI